jgi:hypothetical protein
MFSSFLPSKKFTPYRGLGNTCPICSSSSGKCKAQPYDLSAKNGKTTPTVKTLCMNGTGDNGHPDYHYFNDTRNGTWGIYIPLADWNEHRGESRQATPQEREEWVRNQQLKTQAALEAENKKRLESLPIAERNIVAQNILAQLDLNEIDRQDLIRRGFTPQQIKDIGFKSIDPFQKLSKEPVNPRFPGVNIQGDRLNNWSMGGILIPVYTITGEIVGFQLRNRETTTKGRYRWLSSAWEQGRTGGSPPNLPNGELPLTFVYPQLLSASMGAREIALIEGTGAKPNLGAIKLGQQVIGAAGGQFISSPEQLQDGLQRWRAEIVNLMLDGDDLQKPQVVRRWVNTYQQLIEWGYKPRFMWSGKDIDELDDITDLRELTLEELGKKSGLELKLPITPALLGGSPNWAGDPTSAQQPISMARKLYNKAQKFTPNATQCNRYLKWIIPEVIKNALIAIKSALGTGKTEILKSLAAWAKERGYKLIFVGYRNNLLRQTCDRIPDLYHVGDEDKIMLLGDDHLALCHHSAGKLDPAQMENTILVFDECVSDLRDMISSKLTAGRNPDGTDSRQTRLAHILQLILSCYAVVALDGYMSDTEVEFLQGLRNFDFTHKIENTYKNKMDVRMTKNKSTTTREVIDLAKANEGSILVTATTQKFCENLEKSLIRVGIPKEEIHRFDGTTNKKENNIEFFDNPSNYITKYKPLVLILSPTAESGISIDLTGYFITHYHFHLNNLGILSGLQFLGRYRDFSAPRVVYCEERGMMDEGNSSSFSKWVQNSFDYRVAVDVELLQRLLDQELVAEAQQLLKAYGDKEDPWLKLAHKYKAIHNHEMQHLKELFIERLRDDGYTVTTALGGRACAFDGEEDAGCADTEELFEKVEMERQVIYSSRLVNAPTINKQEYEGIRKNLTANESDKLAASKYYTTQIQLPGIMQTESWSPELVQMIKFTYPGLIKQLENFHYLLNPELAQINHVAAWMPVMQTGSAWMEDQLKRSQLALVKCARVLGLHELVGKEISILELEEIAKTVSDSKLYQSALKVRINPEKPQDTVNLGRKILKKFALKLMKLGDGMFRVKALKDEKMRYHAKPKYELLTPELIERIKALKGGQYTSKSSVIEDLAKELKDLGIYDGRGRMASVAGAARYLQLAVTSRRFRIKRGAEEITTRKYTFSEAPSAISDAIRDTNVCPTNKEVNFAHIYDCVEKRLKELATRQQERIQEWKEAKTNGENPPIPIDDLADIVQTAYPDDLLGSPNLEDKRLTIEKGDMVLIDFRTDEGLVIDCRIKSWTSPKGNSFTTEQCLVKFENGEEKWFDMDVLTRIE